MTGIFARLDDKQAMAFIKQVEEPFAKLPKLPQGIVAFLVSVAPWLTILGAILSLIAGPFMALASVFSILTLSPGVMLSMVLSTVLLFVNAVLLFKAFSPLKERKLEGWILVFWSNIFSIAESVVGMVFHGKGIVGTIFGIVLGLYILFQMKPSYKK